MATKVSSICLYNPCRRPNQSVLGLLTNPRSRFWPRIVTFRHSSQVTSGHLCTLQSLLLIEHEDNDLEPGLVFALRHLPQLRKVDMTSSLSEAIKLFYDSTAHLENAAQEPVTNSFLGRPTHFYILIFA